MQRGISPSVEHVPLVAWKTILGANILSIYLTLVLIFILTTIGKMWLVPQMCNFMDIIAKHEAKVDIYILHRESFKTILSN